jgi:hypothetical protein
LIQFGLAGAADIAGQAIRDPGFLEAPEREVIHGESVCRSPPCKPFFKLRAPHDIADFRVNPAARFTLDARPTVFEIRNLAPVGNNARATAFSAESDVLRILGA